MNNLDKGRTYAKTSGGFYDRYHVWNALKVFPFDNNVYRDRVETIIIRGNKDVFVKKRPDGKYFLPGGSKEKNISDIEQAENECKEEARIIISNIEPTGITIKKGMVIAVEPMLNLGTKEVCILDDGWTIVTEDEMPSAHFEHTVVVTDDGYEILTGDKK